jgi:hypothetical protein
VFPLDATVAGTTAVTWFAKPNGNGVPVSESAPSANEIADTSGSPYYEKLSANSATPQFPCAGHTYGNLIALQEGDHGSVLWATRGAVCNESTGSPTMHKQDLKSALWTRYIAGAAGDSGHVEGWAAHDRNTNRVYFGHYIFWNQSSVHYADLGNKSYSSLNTGYPDGPASGASVRAMAFEKRRLILWHDSLGNIWALDTLNVAGGVHFVQTTGNFAVNDGQASFDWNEEKGYFVQKPGWTGNVVNTLKPPNDRTLGPGGIWEKGSQSIGGAGLPSGIKGPAVGVPQYRQHAYSEELGLHLWVPDSTLQVAAFRL